MTPQERLALALQYQKQRDLGSVLPSMPDPNAPAVEPKQSFLDRLSEAASGAGYGLGEQVESLGQMVRHPLDTLRSMAVGAGKAMDDPSAVIQALKQSAGEAVSSPFNMGRAVGANVNVNPRKLAVMLESPQIAEMTVYHGTPHRFPATESNPLGEFDASKIGTGEGAQAYGHGIYVAESPDVAGGYKKRLAASSYIKDSQPVESGVLWHKAADAALEIGDLHPDNAGEISSQIMDWVDGGRKPETFLRYNRVSPKLQPAYEAAIKEYSGASKNKGSLYTVDLPDEHIERMLDWDKPLSEQPAVLRTLLNADDEWKAYVTQLSPKARKLAEDMAVGVKPSAGDEAYKLFKQLDADNPNADHNAIYDVIRKYNPRTTNQDWIMSMMTGSGAPGSGVRGGGGADLYNTLGGGAEAAQKLRAAGIPGIKYLDAGSRGQGGSGTRNFVIFPGEEKNLKILERK